MFRLLSMSLVLSLVIAASGVSAQTKKPAVSAKPPTSKDQSISIDVFLRDANKNEILLGTRIWPGNPDYTAVALQRFFAVMKALDPPFKQDDEVAYTWSTKSRVAKCSIYLESWDAGAKNGTGATVGCEANGVSGLAVTANDASHTVSSSQDPKHIQDVLDLFKKQFDRAKATGGK